MIYTEAHLTDRAAFLRDFPTKTVRQQQNARAQENVRRRRRGLPELVAANSSRVVFHDKKVGVTDWEEISTWVGEGQALRTKGRWGQRDAKIEIETAYESVLLVPFSDAHIGSWGASLDHLVTLTNDIRNNPRVYLCALGDLCDMAIKLRGVLEVSDDILPPEMQHSFVESWLDAIKHKVLFAVPGNHDVQREEDGAGDSIHRRMLAKEVVYFDGIGHPDIHIGEQVYRLAVTHRFRGSSGANVLAGQKKYMRYEKQDRVIALAGDLHRPEYAGYWDGPTYRVAINCGALQLDSTYTTRNFSLYTIPEYPCVELFRNEFCFIPYRNIGDWKRTVERMGEKP